jgi:hypothetical protein
VRALPIPAAVLALAALETALGAGHAFATTVRVVEIPEHVARSELVVEGRVVGRAQAQADGHELLDWTIAVDRTLHATAGSPREVVVRQLGPSRVVVGDGRLAVGDRVVLFLRRGPHDRFYLTALAQSVFQVLGSGDHAPVARDLSGLALLRQDASGAFVPSPPDASITTLAALRRAVAEASR